MFKHIRFDVQIERTVSAEGLRWPIGAEVESDSGLGCNREYCDLRGVSWTDARQIHAFELGMIRQIETRVVPDEDYASLEEELESADEAGLLMGLDIGVASTVAALSAARCIPVTSCNGGAFGIPHHEVHPLVVFCARSQHLELLVQGAEKASVGLVSNASGYLVVYADDIRKMSAFALALIEMRTDFRQLRFRASGKTGAGEGSESSQLKLFD
ncbi:hypothetical protein [Mesorhizobium xinjiangense]|uniref:hypothetical protein n=1 Tax=Mesorhizobium xinjiangense TaxID=2678685 RepID=UPI0012EDD60E|nr:hypothetical protein [Mesorhizobium xinjiangense]